MRAIQFDLNLAKYAAAKLAGKQLPGLYYGRGSCVSLADVPEPRLRTDEWAKVRPLYAGVCGSDIATLTFKASPLLSAFNSFPCVLGHEVVGVVTEAGAKSGVREGDRVALDPFLGCAARGTPEPCPACDAGSHCLCYCAGDGALAPGRLIGYHRESLGGWGEAMVAHRSQLLPVPAQVPDKVAAMFEPLAIGMHAVLLRPPPAGSHVLVIGGGIIAFAVIAALRLLELDCRITAVAWLPYQAELAKALGAEHTIGGGAPRQVEDALAEASGARRLRTVIGPDAFVGGFHHSFDCIGTKDSIDQALRFTRAAGTVTLIGAAGIVEKLDLTPAWYKELTLVGSLGYAKEPAHGRRHTYEVLAERVASTRLPLERLATHTFPLEEFRTAIRANLERGRFQSVKTLLAVGAAA
ncbi:MAG: zinc-binding dehydrogenase [Myxococcales bacterium]